MLILTWDWSSDFFSLVTWFLYWDCFLEYSITDPYHKTEGCIFVTENFITWVPLFGFVLLCLLQNCSFRKINLIKFLKVQVTEVTVVYFSTTHRWFLLSLPSSEAEESVQSSFVVFLVCSFLISFVSVIHCFETWTIIGPARHPGADMTSFLTGQTVILF